MLVSPAPLRAVAVSKPGEPLEERFGCEQLGAGGRELEREGEAVEPVAELDDGGRGGDVGPHGLGARTEERHGFVAHQRREVELGLALDPERLAAGGEQSQGGNGGHELGQGAGCAGQEMLEVVADDVRPALADASGDRGDIRRRGAQPVGQRRLLHRRRIRRK